MNPATAATQSAAPAFPADHPFYALRDAAGFLDHAAELMEGGGVNLDAPEVVEWFRWAVMKIVEANEALPASLRADISYECFQRENPAL